MNLNPVVKGQLYNVQVFVINSRNGYQHTEASLDIEVYIVGCVCTITPPTDYETIIYYRLEAS